MLPYVARMLPSVPRTHGGDQWLFLSFPANIIGDPYVAPLSNPDGHRPGNQGSALSYLSLKL